MNRIETILKHILDDCFDIEQFIDGVSEAEFLRSSLIRKAVTMSLINIGELVKALPKEFYVEYPSIPWKSIAGMRDLAAHKYKTLNMEAVWLVAVNRVPEIKEFIKFYNEGAILIKHTDDKEV
jgi:uncharacterized protein with HEPN domain